MPARNGTGPTGQGSRTGRGMGNCKPKQNDNSQISDYPESYGTGWFGRMWGNTVGRAFRRGRRNRMNLR